MKLSKVILTALAIMTIASSAFAASTPQNEDYCKLKMGQWAEMCKQGNTVTPVIEANRFYLDGDMRVAYYDEWVNVDKDFASHGITTVGVPEEAQDIWFRGNGGDRP